MNLLLAQELFDYRPESGKLFYRKTGREAKSIGADGYPRCHYNGMPHRVHRIAWLLMTGTFPPDYVDHANRVKHDNRWANLREATNTQNQINSHIRKDNSTGFKGVSHSRHRFKSQIKFDKKNIYLGSFATAVEASEAYCKKAVELYGDFA